MDLLVQQRILSLLNTAVGTLVCTLCAALIAASPLSHGKAMVPILFIAVPVFLASRFGTLAGVLGTLFSAAIFSYYIYPPAGYHIQNAAAKGNLTWLLLAGISLSFLFAGESSLIKPRHGRPVRLSGKPGDSWKSTEKKSS